MSTENTNVAEATKKQELSASVPVTGVITLSPSERFTAAVMKNFSQDNGGIQITPFQKRL